MTQKTGNDIKNIENYMGSGLMHFQSTLAVYIARVSICSKYITNIYFYLSCTIKQIEEQMAPAESSLSNNFWCPINAQIDASS